MTDRYASLHRQTRETDVTLELSLDGGDLKVEGNVDSLTYEDGGRDRSGGLFARLFR